MLNSDYTKQRIIEAAYDLFGKVGFTATTVRMIATQADVSISAIPYYFVNKENLFLQVCDISFKEFEDYFSEVNFKIDSYINSALKDKKEAYSLLLDFIDKHLDYVFDKKNEKQIRFFFQIRSSQDCPKVLKGNLYGVSVRPVENLIKILNPELDKVEAMSTAYFLVGGQLFFFYHKASITKQFDVSDFDTREINTIRSSIHHILNGLIKSE